MKNGILISLFLFLFVQVSYSQVKIKEKVEIEPHISVNKISSGSEATYTYILSWPESSQPWQGNIKVITCNNDTLNSGWTNSGYTTITVTEPGHHIFDFEMKRYYYLSSPGWGWYDDVHPLAQREVFMNGNKIDIGTSTLGSAIGKISSARLEIEDDLCDSTHLGITIDPRNWADCDEAGWFPTDPLTLRITHGKEYIEFYNKATGNFLGDEIFIDQLVQWEDIRLGWGIDWEKDALDDIVLKQINPLPQDSVPLNLIVEASINELIFETEYEFFPDSFSIMTWQYPEVIYSGQTVDIEFEIFNYCESFPEEAEINIEIIEGNEYGGLIDPYTEETVQSIMAIEHYEGYSYFQYIADGAAVDSSVNVVVSISTTDPDLPHRDYNMTIYPSPIVIITEPENLIPGELTNIIIKKRETDGTIVDFSPEQTFEVGMLDGCPIGNIIAGGDTNKYFYDITQPIYFLTDSSADSGTVKLVAGLIEDGGVLIGSNVPHLEGDESNTDTVKSKKEILKERLAALISTNKGKKENKINLVVPGEEEEYCFLEYYLPA